jgi:hypothetical protein
MNASVDNACAQIDVLHYWLVVQGSSQTSQPGERIVLQVIGNVKLSVSPNRTSPLYNIRSL